MVIFSPRIFFLYQPPSVAMSTPLVSNQTLSKVLPGVTSRTKGKMLCICCCTLIQQGSYYQSRRRANALPLGVATVIWTTIPSLNITIHNTWVKTHCSHQYNQHGIHYTLLALIHHSMTLLAPAHYSMIIYLGD